MSKHDKVANFIETVRDHYVGGDARAIDGEVKADRYRFMEEELEEFSKATTLTDQVDALVDLHYFLLGTLYEMGVTSEQYDECFDAVHEANLTKKAGEKPGRTTWTKDAFKPEGWTDPKERIERILDGTRNKETPRSPSV